MSVNGDYALPLSSYARAVLAANHHHCHHEGQANKSYRFLFKKFRDGAMSSGDTSMKQVYQKGTTTNHDYDVLVGPTPDATSLFRQTIVHNNNRRTYNAPKQRHPNRNVK